MDEPSEQKNEVRKKTTQTSSYDAFYKRTTSAAQAIYKRSTHFYKRFTGVLQELYGSWLVQGWAVDSEVWGGERNRSFADREKHDSRL